MTSNNSRPLSPHLQVYKLPLTGIISITHRITGVALCCGLLLLGAMLVSVASGELAYAAMQTWLHTLWVQLIFWANILALNFHICHGIRHLIWDAGLSFDKYTLERYALYELSATMFLTTLCLFIL
jgi:succinate dehydrogenase / fumarate reductase, cytochrome b subunit